MNADAIKVNIKRFLSNKNTVTFILVIVCIVIVYFAYNYLVNQAISPVNIPYSNSLIKGGTKITNDMVGTVKISGTFVTSSGDSLLQARRFIVDKYVAKGYQIPANSFFYSDALVDKAEAEKTAHDEMPDGYLMFSLPVDFHSTYGCAIMAGNYIDLYFKAEDDTPEHKIIYKLFIKSIKVTSVVDKDGKDVFTNTDEGKQLSPKYIYFAVPEEYYQLLETAMLIPSNNISLVPVPRNAGYSENPEETSIANEEIANFIRAKSVAIEN